MGLTERQILTGVELPLALPVLVGGFRAALLQVIATATIGAFLAGGGLGRYIIDGIARRDDGMLYGGVVLVAVQDEIALLASSSFLVVVAGTWPG